MKKLTILSLMIFNFGFAEARYPVISRTVEKCSSPNFWGKEQCSNTKRELAHYTDGNGGTGLGWVIDCEGAGSSGCPKHLAIGDLEDQNDVTWANFLFDYYDEQIAQNNNSGSHSISVLLSNGQYIYYTLTWSYLDNNGEISGYVQIDRL